MSFRFKFNRIHRTKIIFEVWDINGQNIIDIDIPVRKIELDAVYFPLRAETVLRLYKTPTCEKKLSFKRPETWCILWFKLIKSIPPEYFRVLDFQSGILSDISK